MTIEHSLIGTGKQHAVANWHAESVVALDNIAVTFADIGKQAWVQGVGHFTLANSDPITWEPSGPATDITSKADKTVTISGTAGRITGGGDLSGNRTLDLATVGAGSTVGSTSTTLSITYDVYGRVTACTANSIAISESQVTGLVADLAAKAASTTVISAAAIGGTGLVTLTRSAGAFTFQVPTAYNGSSYAAKTGVVTLTKTNGAASGTISVAVREWTDIANVNTTLVAGLKYQVTSLTAGKTFTLPASPTAGQEVYVWFDTFATTNATLAPQSGGTINGGAVDATYTLDKNGTYIARYNGSTWITLHQNKEPLLGVSFDAATGVLTATGTLGTASTVQLYPRNWTEVAANTSVTLTTGEQAYLVNTSAGKTYTLPATPASGDTVILQCVSFSLYNQTLARNGSTINGAAANYTLKKDGTYICRYMGSTWRIEIIELAAGSYGAANTNSGLYSSCVGGSGNTASGQEVFIGAGDNNTLSGANIGAISARYITQSNESQFWPSSFLISSAMPRAFFCMQPFASTASQIGLSGRTPIQGAVSGTVSCNLTNNGDNSAASTANNVRAFFNGTYKSAVHRVTVIARNGANYCKFTREVIVIAGAIVSTTTPWADVTSGFTLTFTASISGQSLNIACANSSGSGFTIYNGYVDSLYDEASA